MKKIEIKRKRRTHILKWKSLLSGAEGQGDVVTKECAESWVKSMTHDHASTLKHWAEYATKEDILNYKFKRLKRKPPVRLLKKAAKEALLNQSPK